jgi:hypothetical protein
VPTTNLIQNVHSSMWVFVKNGHKVKINLYIAIMDAMPMKFVFQQQFYRILFFGNKIGT